MSGKKFGTKFTAAKKALEHLNPGNKVSTYIPAGMASPSPPLGPMLGQKNINIAAFCKDFNQRTAHIKEGIPLPTRVTVRADRSYELVIHRPPSTYFLKQAAGCQTASANQGTEVAGKITLKHIYEIALIKSKDPPLEITPLEEICKLLIGTARSCGIQVVKELNVEDYRQFLAERKEFVEKRALELEEKKKAKLQRTAAVM